ncbi:MAG: dienelactone hydrolase [Actinobacteria bacterium]|nr:dienelactone hydrolase [Actinomycetota bacterium]
MSARFGLVLAPGASAGPDQPALVAIDEAVTAVGGTVARVSIGKGSAERAVPKAQEELHKLCDETGLELGKVFSGGRSFGARVFSMVVAGGTPSAGLVLVSYPLHPPGKPDQLRTEHFPKIKVRCLFVSGTRDAFGTPDELQRATKKIKGPVDHVWIEAGNHGLRGKDAEVAAAVAEWLKTRTTRL